MKLNTGSNKILGSGNCKICRISCSRICHFLYWKWSYWAKSSDDYYSKSF